MLKIIFFKTINVYLNINFQSRTFAHLFQCCLTISIQFRRFIDVRMSAPKVHLRPLLCSHVFKTKCTPSHIAKNQNTTTPYNIRVKMGSFVMTTIIYQPQYSKTQIFTICGGKFRFYTPVHGPAPHTSASVCTAPIHHRPPAEHAARRVGIRQASVLISVYSRIAGL